jgi:RNA polymerase sigma-70 factor (ECF subfamily)
MQEESPRQAEDRRVLTEVAQGSAEALSELYDRLSGPLFGLCLRMTGETEEAEDVLQETFVVIWRRASSYDPSRSTVFGWAVRLARCKAIDHLRSRGRRLRVFIPPAEENGEAGEPLRAADEILASTPSATEDAAQHERAAQVRGIVQTLPADQRQAIELSFFSDLTHHEISARLSQPLGTIKARIRRGLLKLRDGLHRIR